MALTKVIGSGVGELTNKVGLGLSSPAAALHVQTSTDGTGLSGDDIYVARFHNQEATSDRSFGVDIQAGSSTTDQALRIKDHDGTNTLMIVDGLGHITKPKQSAFLATPSSSQTNMATDSNVTVAFATEVFDQNDDFASNTFTAPVTGRYQLSFHVRITTMDKDANYTAVRLNTSNRNCDTIVDSNEFGSDVDYVSYSVSLLMDMDANDTASVVFYQGGGAAQVGTDSNHSFFSGYLVC